MRNSVQIALATAKFRWLNFWRELTLPGKVAVCVMAGTLVMIGLTAGGVVEPAVLIDNGFKFVR